MSCRRRRGSLAALVTALGALVVWPAPATAQTATASAVRFSTVSDQVEEPSEWIRLVVERTGALQIQRLVVDYRTEGVTATGGADYVDASGTVAFEVGERFKTVLVRIRDDREVEPPERFDVRLLNPRGEAASVGAPTTVTIVDDEVAPDDGDLGDRGTPPAATAARRSGTGPTVSSSTATGVPGPAAVAPSASRPSPTPSTRVVRTTRTRRPSPAPRATAARPSPVIPFELRPSLAGDPATVPVPEVDPILAVLAGLFLARVSAELWFRTRAEDA